jgi:hypothetical protein
MSSMTSPQSTEDQDIDNEPVEDQTAYCGYCLLPWQICEGH